MSPADPGPDDRRRPIGGAVALWLATLVYLSLPFLVGPLRTFFWRLIP